MKPRHADVNAEGLEHGEPISLAAIHVRAATEYEILKQKTDI